MRPASPSSLAKAEKEFASLLSGHLLFIIERSQPSAVEFLLAELNSMFGFAKKLGAISMEKAHLFTPEEIKQLVKIIVPLRERKQSENVRKILKEELEKHKIPHDL